jgi:hypothetical protein
MITRQKIGIGILLGLSLAAIVVLATGLSDLRFSPGQPLLPSSARGGVTAPPIGQISAELFGALLQALLLIGAVLLPFAIVMAILKPEIRKRAIRDALTLSGAVLILYMFFRQRRLRPGQTPSLGGNLGSSTAAGGEFVPAPPAWLEWLVIVSLLALVSVAVWLIWRRLRRPPEHPLEQLARQAHMALVQIQAGADLNDTITRCYFEMSRTLSERRGIERQAAMTPREFEERLQAAGLPAHHIGRLTRLFEAVRYGAHTPGAIEEREAVDCLAEIVEACGRE